MDNVFWRGAAPRLSICIPAYRHDVTPLMTALAGCEDAALVELIIHDDGGGDHDLLARLQNEAGRLRIAVRLIAADGIAAALPPATRPLRMPALTGCCCSMPTCCRTTRRS